MRAATKIKPSRVAFSPERVSKSAGIEDWLSALDGVAFLVAPDGTIIGVGRKGWTAFAREVGGNSPSREEVVGRRLFDMIAGDEVKHAFAALHERAATLATQGLTYEYRCDAPDLERLMKMSISALTSQGRLLGVLYQSTLLSAKDRVPLEFLSGASAALEEHRILELPFVTICQFCANVTMQSWAGEWVRPTDYYRRGGDDAVRLSHGICPTCEQTRLEPLLTGRPSPCAPAPAREDQPSKEPSSRLASRPAPMVNQITPDLGIPILSKRAML
jgi:hypothetical protein